MYQFFKSLQSIANFGNEYTSIKELTIDLAKSGGYRREPITLKNGKVVIRTKYGIYSDGKCLSTWNDVLVAKWYLHYKDLFISKLSKHPELEEFYSEIIQRTFTIFFNSLQIDKLKSDSSVTNIVYLSLANRIGEALIKKGSESRLDSYNKTGNYANKNSRERVAVKHAINYMSLSLDALSEDGFQLETPCNTNETVLSIQQELKDNPLGLRLLDSLMYSDTQVDTSNISKFIKLTDAEKTDENLEKLKEAWNIIKSTLYSSLMSVGYDVGVYDWSKDVSFKYVSKRKRVLC